MMTIDASGLAALLHPAFDPKATFDVLARGVNASPGAAKGEVVFTAAEAVEAGKEGRDVILVRPFTDAEDVAGFHAARGFSPPRVARPHTRRWSLAGWVARRWWASTR
jgi:pyruvate, orthophosphate dikinase